MQVCPIFYSLLYVDSKKRVQSNLSNAIGDPLDVYLRCALTLRNSCLANGITYQVLTNNIEALRHRLTAMAADLELIEIATDRTVPAEVAFYEAHFKLDAIRALGSGEYGPLVALVDVDAVVTRAIDFDSPGEDTVWVYDITQIMKDSFGSDAIKSDLINAGAQHSRVSWYGGEFIMGYPKAFARLSNEIERIWPTYVANLPAMHHVGDEAVVSAAIINSKNVLNTIDISSSPASSKLSIARFWTARTLHRASRMRDQIGAVILHLPADKEFLSGFSEKTFSASKFRSAYKAHVRRKILMRLAADFVDLLLFRKPRKFSPRF